MDRKKKQRRTAAVAGASGSIGLDITRALREHGYRVVTRSRTRGHNF